MGKNQLHPGAKWLFRFKIIWAVIFGTFFFGIFSFSLFVNLSKIGIISGMISIWSIIFIILLVLGETWVRLYYNSWFFEFTKDSLRLERGVIWKRYSNVPYDRVQNVDINRGILARIFGFSSLHVQTAGYSGYGRHGRFGAEGSIPAITIKSAERIRDYLMKKIKKGSKGL